VRRAWIGSQLRRTGRGNSKGRDQCAVPAASWSIIRRDCQRCSRSCW
jgi:hypothetical protein